MSMKEFMHNPNAELDQLAEEAERKRTLDEEQADEFQTYIKEKIKMLRKDFHIRLTDEEIAHIHSLETEIAVDNYCHDLFMKLL